MDNRKNRICDLEKCFKQKKIFIDTCSLLHEKVDVFWEKAIPLSRTYNNPIFIPIKCVEELEKHQDHPNKSTAKQARNQSKLLQSLIDERIVSVRGDKGESFADSVFHFVFEKFRVKYNLMLITQDVNLAKEILAKNNSESVIGKKIIVCKLNNNGDIIPFVMSDKNCGGIKNSIGESLILDKKECCSKINQDAFQINVPMVSVSDEPLNPKITPGTGDKVCGDDGVFFTLGKQVGQGGEGKIFDIGKGLVAKVYTKEKCTSFRYDKLQLMLKKHISCPGICYPTSLLYNSRNEFVGYIMPVAKGKELAKSIFIPKPLFLERYNGWKKVDLVQLCMTILEKICFLHNYNVILGDINPSNILVVSPKEVYFVDTDSYQIEGYPCQVGTINFTAPEIQGNHFGSFLRTKGNEYFAVATLLFEILHCGKPPYSQQGGESMKDNIKKMEFPYPFGTKSNRKAPKGAYRYMWSHLSKSLKEAFYCTFQKGEQYSTEYKRLQPEIWLHKIKEYHEELVSGEAGEFDKMSEEIFPTRFKKWNKEQRFEKCKSCGQEYDTDFLKSGFCPSCFQNKKQQEWERKNLIEEVRVCQNCGRSFELTVGECDFYRQKDLDFPKRCPNCRGKNRQGYSGYGSGNSQNKSLNQGWFDSILNWMS